jgi:hypothetical protein
MRAGGEMNKEQTPIAQDEARFQFRISVDPGMGPFHDWLTSLSPSVRSRELLYLMRLGFSVSQGGHFPSPGLPMASMAPSGAGIGSGTSSVVAPGSTAKGKEQSVNKKISAEDAAREQVAAFDAEWDIVSMCTPPPLEELRRH